MSDYLRELGAWFGGNGIWTGGGLVLAAVVVAILAGAWILFRKSSKRDQRYDWGEEGAELSGRGEPREVFADEEGGMQGAEADLFGSGEEKQVQLESDVQGLSHRLTVVTVLIPLLFVIVLVFVYLDVGNRIGRLEDPDAPGNRVARALYEDLSEKVTALSEALDRIEQVQAKRLSDLEARMSASEKAVKAQAGKFEAMTSSTGEDERATVELANRLEKVDTRLSSVEENVASHGVGIEELSEKIARQAKQNAEALSQQKKTLQGGMERISKMDRDVTEVKKRFLELKLSQKLLSEAKAEGEALEMLRARQDEMRETLMERIESLEADITRLAEQFVRSSVQTTPVDEVREDDAEAGAPSPEGSANIFEQDISR